MLHQEPLNVSQSFINPGDVTDKLGLIVQKRSHGLLDLSIPLRHPFSSHCLSSSR